MYSGAGAEYLCRVVQGVLRAWCRVQSGAGSAEWWRGSPEDVQRSFRSGTGKAERCSGDGDEVQMRC